VRKPGRDVARRQPRNSYQREPPAAYGIRDNRSDRGVRSWAPAALADVCVRYHPDTAMSAGRLPGAASLDVPVVGFQRVFLSIERSPGPAEHGLPIRRRPGWPSPDREYARRRRRWQCEPPPRSAAASPAPEPDEARDHARGNPSLGQSATSRSGRATSSGYRTHSPDLPIPVGAGPPPDCEKHCGVGSAQTTTIVRAAQSSRGQGHRSVVHLTFGGRLPILEAGDRRRREQLQEGRDIRLRPRSPPG